MSPDGTLQRFRFALVDHRCREEHSVASSGARPPSVERDTPVHRSVISLPHSDPPSLPVVRLFCTVFSGISPGVTGRNNGDVGFRTA